MRIPKRRIGSDIIGRRFRNLPVLEVAQENVMIFFHLEVPFHFINGIVIKGMIIRLLGFLVMAVRVKGFGVRAG